MDLPENATPEQLEVLQAYLKQQKKVASSKGYGKKDFYKQKHEILGSKLIIYLNSQKKSDIWYMRMHVGGKPPYKFLSLRTSDKATAIEKALDHWRNLKNHIESGGSVFEKKTSEVIDAYLQHLDELVETEQLKKHTVQCKRTGFKKLKEYLSAYEKPSDIPSDIFKDYTKWRRTKNWTKYHKNNTKPPSDLTVNKELTDFKGFFDWCSSKNIRTNDFKFPWLSIDPDKLKEASPPFTNDDYGLISKSLDSWSNDKDLEKQRKNTFYRKVFAHYWEILAQSGLRPHEALKLRWSDVEIISEFEKVNFKMLYDFDWSYKPEFEEGFGGLCITTMDGMHDVFPETDKMPARRYFTKKTLENLEESVKKKRDWFEVEFVGAKIKEASSGRIMKH